MCSRNHNHAQRFPESYTLRKNVSIYDGVTTVVSFDDRCWPVGVGSYMKLEVVATSTKSASYNTLDGKYRNARGVDW